MIIGSLLSNLYAIVLSLKVEFTSLPKKTIATIMVSRGIKTANDKACRCSNSGRGAARLARLHGVQEAKSSNLFAPTAKNHREQTFDKSK